jgi:uncharacterized protein YqjF (DUF2071 family)
MKIPVVRGVIDRRILVNYRVDPSVLAAQLPQPFHPKVFRGVALAGICLIRLRNIRPRFCPSWLGISSENAAHRAAVEWRDKDTAREGVYIRRRDTSSRLNSIVGGRLFPGIHHHAHFQVEETADHFAVALASDDGATSMSVRGHRTDRVPATSVFQSLEEASAFFQSGSLGYSATQDPSSFQGLELKCLCWKAKPLEVEEVRSSFFDGEALFPKGSVEFDCALLMRGIEHEWLGQPDICCRTPLVAEAGMAGC